MDRTSDRIFVKKHLSALSKPNLPTKKRHDSRPALEPLGKFHGYSWLSSGIGLALEEEWGSNSDQ